jgi:hypothetical protein
MTGILDFVTGLVSGIGGLFGGGLGQLLNQLTENLVTIGLLAFAIGLGVFAITYLNRRRQTMDQQRFAAIIKGLHRSGLAQEVLTQPAQDPRDHLLRGLRWLFGAAGLSSAMYGYESMQPAVAPDAALSGALIGLIPGALGLAHLLFSWLSSRRSRPAASMRPNGLYRAAARPGGLYRAAAYRPAVRRF